MGLYEPRSRIFRSAMNTSSRRDVEDDSLLEMGSDCDVASFASCEGLLIEDALWERIDSVSISPLISALEPSIREAGTWSKVLDDVSSDILCFTLYNVTMFIMK